MGQRPTATRAHSLPRELSPPIDSDDLLRGIRRLDWRFLLPDPRLGRVAHLGAPGSLLEALELAGSAVTALGAGTGKGTAQRYDLVVVSQAEGRLLRRAAELLRPGGLLYAEIRRSWRASPRTRPPGRASRALATLRRAGLTDARAYWHWPDFERCAEIVPLAERPLLLHALSRRRSDPVARVKTRVARWLVSQGSWERVVPCFSVVARSPDAPPSRRPASASSSGRSAARPPSRSVDDTAASFLAAHRRRLGVDALKLEEPLSSVLITPRFRASSHVVFLILGARDQEPRLVAKVPRLQSAARHLEREAANLRALQQRPLDSVPHLVALAELHGVPLLLETALNGMPLDRAAVRGAPLAWCQAVLDWLEQLPGERDPLGDAELERLVDQPLELVERACALEGTERQRVRRSAALGQALRGGSVPAVFEHGDLSHPNVIRRADGRIGVLDWELATPRGLPLCDLFFFLTYVAFARERVRSGADQLRAFDRAFFGASAWARPWVLAGADRFGVPRRALRPLFVLCWARSVARLAHRLDDPLAPPGPFSTETRRWLRDNRYFRFWQHSLDHLERLSWHEPRRRTARGG